MLNNNDVDILNSRVASSIPINKNNKNIVIVQQNAIRDIINKLQIKYFIQANKQDIILFLDKHFQTRKKGSQIVKGRKLLTI